MSGEISLTEFLPTLHRTLSARHSRTLSKNDSAESEGSHFNGRPALPGFVILISSDGQSSSRVYGTPADRAGLTAGDEIIEVNGTPIEGKDHNEIVNIIHRCIKSRMIQLRVRRTQDIGDDGVSSVPRDVNITDAYLVSVDKDHIKEMNKKLKRHYPGIKTHDMEAVASAPDDNHQQTPSNSKSSPSHENIEPQKQSFNFDLYDSGNGSSSPPSEDQRERLKKYEKDLKKRKELDEQKAKEYAFLRASLRGSRKLRALEDNRTKSADVNDGEIPRMKTEPFGYSNRCYISADNSYRENLDSLQNEPIPLEEVIQSANRVAEHLEKSEGRQEESRLIREYFSQEPIKQAIEATSAARRAQSIQFHPSCSVSQENGTSKAHEQLKIVKLFKDHDSYLGATVRNDGERVVVGRVVKGGVVDRSNLLKPGDELIEVNGVDLRGKNIVEVCDILHSINGELSLVVAPLQNENRAGKDGCSPQFSSVHHVRALFDYDPEDDFYVPCKELALKFQRGDILHVISTSDDSWWQAYREGDDFTNSLAGLIPSASFQEQVVKYNREVERENSGDRKKQKDVFGCAKKKSLSKLKGKRAVDDLRSVDEIGADDPSEILTYEDVSLYLSKTGRKRPIVLCGPEGVGCLILRQRLLESDKDKFASAIPYTTRPKKLGEVDGVHFYFVTRQKFQEDAKAGKFIEYGEYQKYLYGTSIASIQAVVDRAKICLLSLKAENLKALRRTSLMPFVVFIAPPSLQQLRRQKEMLGQHGVSDECLKLVLNEGKITEQTYGHLFDRIIVNIDLDRTLSELKEIVRSLETEPHWVPSFWLHGNTSVANR